jgi:predicted nucleotide-binding protein (sugar kinase/HSP70/actin superfamily)
MKIQATQTERDQLNEKCTELSTALHNTQKEAAAAAEKAMQEAKSLRDEIAEQVPQSL